MSNNLPIEKKATVVSLLCEGNSIRSIERITSIHRDTIMRLGVRVGQGCKTLLSGMMRGLTCDDIQVDELWGFIGAKKKTVDRNNLNKDFGDVWVWSAIDANTKLVPCYSIGNRDLMQAMVFMEDLASRLQKRPQISSDALRAYKEAIENAFGSEVDYGTVIKTYSHTDLEESRRYSPPDCLQIKKSIMQGNPDIKRISTSYIEKQNHTTRMHCRRLSRLTNAFSKKRENFDAAVSLHYAYYNLCKRHQTIRCTPAMEAGVQKSQWSVIDLVEATDSN